MSGEKVNLCAKINSELHKKIKANQTEKEMILADYVEQVFIEYYQMMEGKKMSNQEKGNIRTLALQVSEELFQRIDQCVAKYPNLNKKVFLTKIITEGLERMEAGATEEENSEDQD